MKTKKCSQCKQILPIEQFHCIISENRFRSSCKICLYKYQKNRWKNRKQKAIQIKGGCCKICGYNKNYAALEFHHLEPREKELDWNKLRQVKWEHVIEELKKCVLLCSNCHREVHNPDAFVKEVLSPPSLNLEMKSTGNCPFCGTETYGTKYCSKICCSSSRRKVSRPNRDELSKLISSMSLVEIGKKYGVSDNSIRKWAKCYGLI